MMKQEKFCKCGCGLKPKIITHTNNALNKIRGEYGDFLKGHYLKIHPLGDYNRQRMKVDNPMWNISKEKKEQWKEKMSIACMGRPSPNPKGMPRPEITGKHHPNWQGGISKEEYGKDWNIYLKEKTRLRDGYKCKKCGVSQLECIEKLCVHHIDRNKMNNNSLNLISLCRSCHIKIHRAMKIDLNK